MRPTAQDSRREGLTKNRPDLPSEIPAISALTASPVSPAESKKQSMELSRYTSKREPQGSVGFSAERPYDDKPVTLIATELALYCSPLSRFWRARPPLCHIRFCPYCRHGTCRYRNIQLNWIVAQEPDCHCACKARNRDFVRSGEYLQKVTGVQNRAGSFVRRRHAAPPAQRTPSCQHSS